MTLDADAVRRALSPFWRELQAVEQTASTNDDVLALAVAGAGEGLVRTAEFQTAGRGRLARSWQAPPGSSVMFSMLLRPTAPMARWGWIPLIAGLGVRDALVSGGVDAALKWPNDIQVGTDRRKCGGILTQVAGDGVVVGIGLNVERHEGLPAEAAVIGDHWAAPREEVLRAALNGIAERYRAWIAADGDADAAGVLSDYREACGTVGQRVRVLLPDPDGERAVVGLAIAVDGAGGLVVETPEGELIVGAGDVIHVRPAG